MNEGSRSCELDLSLRRPKGRKSKCRAHPFKLFSLTELAQAKFRQECESLNYQVAQFPGIRWSDTAQVGKKKWH